MTPIYKPASHKPVSALTIAGSDSSGGAGIQADLKTFHRLGVYGQSAVTLITAQNTTGVMAVHVLPVRLVEQQIDAVLSDIGAAAIKTGALGSAALIHAVAQRLKACPEIPLVADPVLISKHGHLLVDVDAKPEAIIALRDHLMPMATVITPNWFEAAALSCLPVTTPDQALTAARWLLAHGARAVLLKGGGESHFGSSDAAHDILVEPAGDTVLPGIRVATTHLHGSGCTFAAAITAYLALGQSLAEAALGAKAFIAQAIATAPGLGRGRGPVNHWA